jgi:hypothetical protein
MRRQGVRRSVLLLVAAGGLIMSLVQAPVAANDPIEACFMSKWQHWAAIDSDLDSYAIWRNRTPGHCLRII